MATEYWIQIENHLWDVSPSGVDRMTGKKFLPTFQLAFPPPPPPNIVMYKPMEALILRRYTANWAAPDDRKVNPWDLNERDPVVTMGTIPGATIECNVGDTVTVHFRNMDMRLDPNGTLLSPERRAHSLHPHGFVFAAQSDGAYPLSPADPAQPIPADEVAAWSSLSVSSGLKQGDRVPAPVAGGPNDKPGTFTYTWQTIGWPTTAGVWLYHDHSICDMDNVELGAIGIIVIHNTNDPEDVPELLQGDANLPGGSHRGSPMGKVCFPIEIEGPLGKGFAVMPHQLAELGKTAAAGSGGIPMMSGMDEHTTLPAEKPKTGGGKKHTKEEHREEPEGPAPERTMALGDFDFELDDELARIITICLPGFRTPPARAQYLQLFHTLSGQGMCINGRKWLGNTPTVVAGPQTQMRFGVVGMGSDFHTFHLHGHRWVIPGPHGTGTALQSSIQDQAVSQFEDTRLLGPANSFVFTIEEGSGFMRALPPQGEWHMHCHVLGHMMDGMMGSLLIVNGGELFTPLPVGVECPPIPGATPDGQAPTAVTVTAKNFAFSVPSAVKSMGTVTLKNDEPAGPNAHSIIWDSATPSGTTLPSNSAVVQPGGSSSAIAMPMVSAPVTLDFHCGVHPGMKGSIVVQP